MVYQRLTAKSFSEMIFKMIDYKRHHSGKQVEFHEMHQDRRAGDWKATVTRNGNLFDS